MQVTKFKLTAKGFDGCMIIIYSDGHFKSVVNEFSPLLSDKQLNYILGNIPDDPNLLIATFELKSPGKITVVLSSDPTELADPVMEKMATNKKVALWCRLYEEKTKRKYKTNKSEAGKLSNLVVNAIDLESLIRVYLAAEEWYLKPKSVSNFIVKYNEVRALAFSPAAKSYPLPYSEAYDAKLTTADRVGYWKFLRENGYTFLDNGRVRKWVKKEVNNV